MDNLKKAIEELVTRAAESKDSADAMRFSQAAMNAANVASLLKSIEPDED